MVCEEAPQAYSYGARAKMKSRFIGGVVTPAQPQYLHGMVDDRADAHDFQEAPPILGIAAAVGGYKVQLLLHLGLAGFSGCQSVNSMIFIRNARLCLLTC